VIAKNEYKMISLNCHVFSRNIQIIPSLVWWHIPIIPTPRRGSQVQGQFGLHNKTLSSKAKIDNNKLKINS
jgi:hypothetical protein